MSQVYTARRRTAQDHTQAAAPASQGRQAAPGLGADAQASGMGSRLEELMQERMRQHFLDHQIPEGGLLRRPLPHGFRRLPHRRGHGGPGLRHRAGHLLRPGGL